MSDISMHKTHPVMIIAAAALILTCLLAIGVMTGIIPSPLTRGVATQQELTTAPDTKFSPNAPAATVREERPVARAPVQEYRAPVQEQRRIVERPAAPRAPVGATNSSAASNTVAGSSPAPAPLCTNCGTVSSVNAVREQGQASMIGPAAGGLLGGLAGNQIGGGSGKTIATIAGAAVGAGVGTEVERRTKATTHYNVNVRMNDGTVRTVRYDSTPSVQAGDRVRVVDGRLVRD